jgi:gamma-glutamyltranspeptidase/glutathione hydrolase
MRLRYRVLFISLAFIAASANTIAQPVALTASIGLGDRPAGTFAAGRSVVLARNGMVASAQPLASQIGIDILKRGGSALDAAIATNAALGLMEPGSAGIGGDLFAIVWDPRAQKLFALNASGRAPRGQDLATLRARLHGADRIPLYGSAAVTVPGAVDGWFALHARFGKLSMRQLLAPTIGYARQGFPVTQVIASEWSEALREFAAHADDIEEFANAKRTFTIDGRAPRVGEVFRNADLATTLELIAQRGRAAFYSGPIAKAVDRYMQRIGGALRYDDFVANESTWTEPACSDYRGYAVCEIADNTQGIAVLQMLNILEGFDLAALQPGSAELLHLEIESKRLVYEDRARYYADPNFGADPQFAQVPLAQLLSKSYAAQRRALIKRDRALPNVAYGDPQVLQHGDTTYISTADRDGMMVSLIQSNYSLFGSGLVPDGLGFMLHNRGNLFSLDAQHANVYAPGKRPFHTIIPAFVLKNNQPWLSFGVMGGAMQPQGQVQVLVNIIDFGMNLQEAGDAARFYHDGSHRPNRLLDNEPAGVGTVLVESGVRNETVIRLRELGHQVDVGAAEYGGYQAIMRDPDSGVYSGATELRKDGAAIGY